MMTSNVCWAASSGGATAAKSRAVENAAKSWSADPVTVLSRLVRLFGLVVREK